MEGGRPNPLLDRLSFGILEDATGSVKPHPTSWAYPRYDSRGEYTHAKKEAREAERRLRADKDQMPPWDRRKQQRAKARRKRAN